ncbi:mitochondrial large ribosomal subunit [Tieghemiomyces parasiticus]|uniref:Large ribosomal subunit protein mL49 n=1 Tax=Tieghemiomyces parasiticus TaxID=78921 RepID=A0A9W8AKI0_9FUNG|nr:mitochondrial large ribosomal subunit [Tieghemiomyces parasiticus]
MSSLLCHGGRLVQSARTWSGQMLRGLTTATSTTPATETISPVSQPTLLTDTVTGAATVKSPSDATSHLPYQVKRTINQSLPVYTDYRNGRTRHLTIIRRVFGDREALMSDLKEGLGTQDITLRKTNGHIWVKGNRRVEVLEFLTKQGF